MHLTLSFRTIPVEKVSAEPKLGGEDFCRSTSKSKYFLSWAVQGLGPSSVSLTIDPPREAKLKNEPGDVSGSCSIVHKIITSFNLNY